jgi:DNA (cytosine-5)-methyltransferase 1
MIYFSSHFSGCGGSTIGAIAAGLNPISAIEFDPRIAELYQANCGNVVVEDISQINFKKLDIPTKKERNGDILVHQASPPCQDYSRANTSANKGSERANILGETYDFYRLYEPEFIILENVVDYAKASVCQEFESFLINMGYRILKGKFNAADYGVPQTRERFLIIAAAKGFDIPKVIPTHEKQKDGQISLFTKSWVGWYEAIADLIPSLPDSHLTPKQQEAVTAYENLLIDFANSTGGYKSRKQDEPTWTINASVGKHNAYPRALLVERVGYRDSPKAKPGTEPCWTIRATLGDDQKGKNGKKSGTRTKIIDAILDDATVKSINTHALARLQSFPDSYKWSEKAAVDTKGIGNSVAPLLMQRICEAIKSTLN